MSNNPPLWLPPLIKMEKMDVMQYIDCIYAIFKRDIIESKITFSGKPIIIDARIKEGGKEEGFWHVTSCTDKQTGERLPDIRRCERIEWIGSILKNKGDSLISIWENKRGKDENTLLLLESFGHDPHLIVLKKKSRFYILKTSYCVDIPSELKKILKERNLILKR